MNGLKKTLWIAGFGLMSFSISVSAFDDLISNKVVWGSSSSSDKVEIPAPAPVSVFKERHIEEPRVGEVLLEGNLSESIRPFDPANRHSEVVILPQNNEVQFLDSAEREALLSLLSHFQQADALIQRAQAYQRPDQRIKFRYDWLRLDLHKIQRSMLDHLNSPENQTRFFEPLNDDYRR